MIIPLNEIIQKVATSTQVLQLLMHT